MSFIILLVVVVIVIFFVKNGSVNTLVKNASQIKPTVKYHYRRKDFIMTRAENDFFNSLTASLGNEYYVFPQVHLSAILDHKVKGQNFKAAFSYINQKSVDYVVCNRQYRRPILAIELDDWSHDKSLRKQRDLNVDFLFKESGLPLLRLRDVKTMTNEDLKAKIAEYLPGIATTVKSANSDMPSSSA